MYNEKQKLIYCESTGAKSEYFLKTEQYEELIDKDVCNWSVADIIDFYKGLNTPSVDFLQNITSQYRQYVAWCQAENLINDNMNHFNEIDRFVLQSCVNQLLVDSKILTRKELLDQAREIPNPVDKYIMLACFEGIGGKRMLELINSKLSDFREDGYVQLCSGRQLPYSSELYLTAQVAAETYIYYSLNSKGVRKTFELLGDSNTIVKKIVSKDTENTEVNEQSIYRRLQRYQDYFQSAAYTTKALKESGRIQLINETMTKYNCSPIKTFDKEERILTTYGDLNSRVAYLAKYSSYIKRLE